MYIHGILPAPESLHSTLVADVSMVNVNVVPFTVGVSPTNVRKTGGGGVDGGTVGAVMDIKRKLLVC